jgi:hypothetical protein
VAAALGVLGLVDDDVVAVDIQQPPIFVGVQACVVQLVAEEIAADSFPFGQATREDQYAAWVCVPAERLEQVKRLIDLAELYADTPNASIALGRGR